MKSVYTVAVLALIGSSSAIVLDNKTKQSSHNKGHHACDFIDDNGEEISTSLMPEYVQLSDNTDDAQSEVAKEKEKWANMQAQMDAAVADADNKRAE